MSLQGPLKREARGSEAEMEEAELLAVKMEGEATARDVAPLRNWKRLQTEELALPTLGLPHGLVC